MLQHIACHTMHVTHSKLHMACYTQHVTTHCMSHMACNTQHVTTQHMHLMCLFQISCSSFCFVSAMMESGQVIPLHIASADNMADFGTATSMFVDLCRCRSWLTRVTSICDVYWRVSTTCSMSVPLYIMVIACTHVLIPNISLFVSLRECSDRVGSSDPSS